MDCTGKCKSPPTLTIIQELAIVKIYSELLESNCYSEMRENVADVFLQDLTEVHQISVVSR
jgi:hypothetical protein